MVTVSIMPTTPSSSSASASIAASVASVSLPLPSTSPLPVPVPLSARSASLGASSSSSSARLCPPLRALVDYPDDSDAETQMNDEERQRFGCPHAEGTDPLSPPPLASEDILDDIDETSDKEPELEEPRTGSFSVADTDVEPDADIDAIIDNVEESRKDSDFRYYLQQIMDHSHHGNAKDMNINVPPPISPDGKFTLILDLDETLLHSFFPEKLTPYQYNYVKRCALQEEEKQRKGEITFEQREYHLVDVGDGTVVVCHLRPGMWEFLRRIFSRYHIGVWSAGGRMYVDNICKLIFPSSTPQPVFALCWEDCHVETSIQTAHFVYTKPFHKLTERFSNLRISHLILVDNRKENGFHYPQQIVHAPDWIKSPWLASSPLGRISLQVFDDDDIDNYLLDQCLEQIEVTIRRTRQIYGIQDGNGQPGENSIHVNNQIDGFQFQGQQVSPSVILNSRFNDGKSIDELEEILVVKKNRNGPVHYTAALDEASEHEKYISEFDLESEVDIDMDMDNKQKRDQIQSKPRVDAMSNPTSGAPPSSAGNSNFFSSLLRSKQPKIFTSPSGLVRNNNNNIIVQNTN